MWTIHPVHIIIFWTILPFLSLSAVPSTASTPSCSYLQTTLRCRWLNTTADILDTNKEIVQSVVKIEISDSKIECLEWRHFSRFQNLEEIELTRSGLQQVMCIEHGVRHKKAAHQLRYLQYLNLASNALTELDDGIRVAKTRRSS